MLALSGAGCGIRLYRFLIIASLSALHIRPFMFVLCGGPKKSLRTLNNALNSPIAITINFHNGVWGRMWNSIVSVPDHCLFIYVLLSLLTIYMYSIRYTNIL